MTSALLLVGLAAAAPLVLTADEVHTVSGDVVKDGVVVVEDGRIAAVGTAGEVVVPDGAETHHGAVLTPGFVDTYATVGLTGPRNHAPDQDHAESDRPVRPALRALDAFHSTDPLVGWLRGLGITTANVGPSPGQPVSGRTFVTHLLPGQHGDIALDPDAFVVLSLGDVPKARFGSQGSSSRMVNAATVRQALVHAEENRARRQLRGADRAPRDLGLEALVELLDGERRAIVHAHRADDLLTALRIADEFSLDIVLAGAAEGWLVADALAAAGVPVLVGPVMARSWREGEQRSSSFENAARLADAGVKVGFVSGYEGYVPKVRVVHWEAAVAGANGLGRTATLRALTLDAAEILGVGDEIGSVEVGKRADLVLHDGDPLEVTSHACVVVVDGAVVSDTCR